MLRKLHRGSTSRIITIFIRDAAAADGSGLAGLTYASGLTCWYKRDDQSAAVKATLVAGTVGQYVSGGFVAVPNMPGVYEFGVPDAALASGGASTLLFRDVPGGVTVPVLIELDAVDYQNAATFGLTAVPATLVAAGLDAIPTTDPGSPANMNSLPKMLVALWRAEYGPTRLTPGSYLFYKDDGVGVNATQSFVDNTVDQIRGRAQ